MTCLTLLAPRFDCLWLKKSAPRPPLLHSKEVVAPVSECSMKCYCLVIVWFPSFGFPIHAGWFPNHPFWDSETSLVSRWHATEVVLHVLLLHFLREWHYAGHPGARCLGSLTQNMLTFLDIPWHIILKLCGQEHTQSIDSDPEVGRLRKLDVNFWRRRVLALFDKVYTTSLICGSEVITQIASLLVFRFLSQNLDVALLLPTCAASFWNQSVASTQYCARNTTIWEQRRFPDFRLHKPWFPHVSATSFPCSSIGCKRIFLNTSEVEPMTYCICI